MPLSCPQCDAFALSGTGSNTTLTCSSCKSQVPANFLPLFLISGPSGAGKSTLIRHLRPLLPDCLVVGGDLLVDVTNRDRNAFLKRWLLIAYANAQSGRPLVLAGVIEKSELEACPDRALVGEIYSIALAVGEETRRERLEERPRWKKHDKEKLERRIAEHVGMGERLVRGADLVVDTEAQGVEEVAGVVAGWVRERVVVAEPSMAPAG
ncbi:P-loop containing nucleoside triphosphate hydrolase protein [Podospora aff. communis PSN243]|uniref:P-loop containing nucleoside triphosphate hydrolase protein n=1 Tax=Podospora aff. communis PSN243 TaxID=3040156 RepID=A0AAV9GPJ2_9PEZI|nr:P-loop containing nucleoside triphosphate hydrolase protein [Podospora aff. communis PSN243]